MKSVVGARGRKTWTGPALRLLREARGLHQTDVALHVGISRAALGVIEGKALPSDRDVERYLRAINTLERHATESA